MVQGRAVCLCSTTAVSALWLLPRQTPHRVSPAATQPSAVTGNLCPLLPFPEVSLVSAFACMLRLSSSPRRALHLPYNLGK